VEKHEPIGNDPSCALCSVLNADGVNEIGFKANVSVPQTSNFGVARLDHDFGSKVAFTSSYRYYKLILSNTSQIDIGGFFPGDTLARLGPCTVRPQQPGTTWPE